MKFQKRFQGTLTQYWDTDELASEKRLLIVKQEFDVSKTLYCCQDGTPVSENFFEEYDLEIPDLITWLRTEEDIPKWAHMFEVAQDLDYLIAAIPKDDWAAVVAKLPNYVRQRIVTAYKKGRRDLVGKED